MKPEDRKRLKQHIEMIVEHKTPAEIRLLEMESFMRRCFALDVFRNYPRLRDEALMILDGELDSDPVPDPNIMFCPNCECDRETVLYSKVMECTVCREGFEVVCGIKQSNTDLSVTQIWMLKSARMQNNEMVNK